MTEPCSCCGSCEDEYKLDVRISQIEERQRQLTYRLAANEGGVLVAVAGFLVSWFGLLVWGLYRLVNG